MTLRPRTSSLQSQSTLREGTPSSLSQKSGHLKNEDVTSKADRGNEIILHSELFVVPGAQNFMRVLKASNFA